MQEYFWLYGLSQGYTEEAIAGIMGNIYQERSNSTKETSKIADVIASGNDDWDLYATVYGSYGKQSIGIVSWTDWGIKDNGKAYGNYTYFIEWCTKNGMESTDFAAQVQYLFETLDTGGLYAQYGAELRLMTSVSAATRYFHNKFEKPQEDTSLTVRQIAAEAYYERFHGITLASSSYSSSSSTELGEQIAEKAEVIAQQIASLSGLTHEWISSPTLAKILQYHKVTCATYVSAVLQEVGVLDSGEYISHRNDRETKNTVEKVLATSSKGTVSKLKNSDKVKLVYVNKAFSDLSPQYKTAGCIYVWASNIGIYMGNGTIYSFSYSGSKVRDYSYNSYNFNHNILVVIVPQ